MSTHAYANARELKDIATLLDSIQRIADRASTKTLIVSMGSIAIYNQAGEIVGFAEEENGLYAFRTVSEHVEQKDDDPILDTSAMAIIERDSHESIESREMAADAAAMDSMDEPRALPPVRHMDPEFTPPARPAHV
jgi:hypothetical protein